jgi:hypothetical protein
MNKPNSEDLQKMMQELGREVERIGKGHHSEIIFQLLLAMVCDIARSAKMSRESFDSFTSETYHEYILFSGLYETVEKLMNKKEPYDF